MKHRTWGDVCRLDYGKALREYTEEPSDENRFRVYGTNGPIGWSPHSLSDGPGVIIGRKGAYRGIHFSPEPFFAIDTAYLLRPNDAELDVKWAYYKLQTVNMDSIDVGAAIPTTSRDAFYSVPVSIPTRKAQVAAAATLSAYDELMENNRRRMGLLEEAARLLYREWFVRLRFPGHEHAGLTNGVPEGWENVPLGEIADVNRATLSNSFDGEIEYVDIASVVPGQITETTTYDFREAPSRARRIVQHGDIIWSCVRPNRRSHAVIWKPADNLIVSTGFAVITPTVAPSTFIYFATTADEFVGYLQNHARGAAYPAVVAADFEQAKILVPPKVLLESFDEIVEPMISQIHNLRQQTQKLRAARDLLLPRLMSGEIAV